MVLKGDDGPTLEGDDMFNLKQITSNKDIDTVMDREPDILAESDEEEKEPKRKFEKYNKDEGHLDKSGLYYKDSDSEIEMESDEDEEEVFQEGLGLFFLSTLTN